MKIIRLTFRGDLVVQVIKNKDERCNDLHCDNGLKDGDVIFTGKMRSNVVIRGSKKLVN